MLTLFYAVLAATPEPGDAVSWLLSPASKDVTASAVLIAAVIAVFSGFLVPGRTVKRELADKDKIIAGLEKAAVAKDQLNLKLAEQNGLLMKGTRTTDAFFQAVLPPPTPAQKPDGDQTNVAT